ncbi:glycosyltransferase family 4 protein [Pseudanabaena mucicola]|uniref:Glycosyltransferase family 4 protein n=1 Tax=Pseudanabaena mucicola FACHB-723 TaxID=2692860 RepID=A0ABR7ZTW0_9CYAN|nr:glycosyltransferase family 4 protein [Pseudanabaena mucicola]MBD2187418.1 glycosyltransferase family 4 protein [Pseudanabaena mucicola FACHB-723]
MILSNKIYHCSANIAIAGGGVKTYVDSLYATMPDTFGTEIIAHPKDYDQSDFKLLHIHEASAVSQINNFCPVVFTAHNHDVYCPSGTKYLSVSKSCCDRLLNTWGCAWGHAVDGCGSRRPAQIITNLVRASNELNALKKLGVLTIANSDYVRSQLIANGLPESQVVTLRCGIAEAPVEHFPLEQSIHDQKHILFMGRIVPEKGLDWLLQTMPLLDPKIHLDIAGEGWAMPQMRQLAEKLNINDRITWHGWCQNERLENLYRQSFAVVFPSVWPEPAGLVTLESYARFRAVIASDVGGIPEHIQDGKTGILVKPNDKQQLAIAIMDLANNFEKSRKIGINGNALFHQEFSLSIHAKRLKKIYDMAITQFTQRSYGV